MVYIDRADYDPAREIRASCVTQLVSLLEFPFVGIYLFNFVLEMDSVLGLMSSVGYFDSYFLLWIL